MPAVLVQRKSSYSVVSELMATVLDAPTQRVKTLSSPKIKFKIIPVKWVDLMSIVSLRVITFYPELCRGGGSNEAMKQSIMNKMIQRGNEGSVNLMAQEEGGFFHRNLLGAVEISPADFRGTVMEKIGADRKLYLGDLCIRQDFRNMGIATSLLTAVEEYALQKNYMEIYMHVEVDNAVARNLYAKNGYSVIPPSESSIQFTESRLKKSATGFLLLMKSLSGLKADNSMIMIQ
jgi:ribosomal protein S18 acetylase RimI-like enzyme